jgi:hypothetical protein
MKETRGKFHQSTGNLVLESLGIFCDRNGTLGIFGEGYFGAGVLGVDV